MPPPEPDGYALPATRPQRLVLVRHAESTRNVARGPNRFFLDEDARRPVVGMPDHAVPLTPAGERQAEATGIALRTQFGVFDYVYHSGYRRAEQTAQAILAAYAEPERAQMPVRHNLFLRERDTGYAYDMTTAEAEAAFPWLQSYWDTFGAFFARPPGGESLADVAARVYLFLNMLFRDRAGQRILVVTHGGTIRTIRFLLERWTYEEAIERFRAEPIPNCAVTSDEFDAGLGRFEADPIGGNPGGCPVTPQRRRRDFTDHRHTDRGRQPNSWAPCGRWPAFSCWLPKSALAVALVKLPSAG